VDVFFCPFAEVALESKPRNIFLFFVSDISPLLSLFKNLEHYLIF